MDLKDKKQKNATNSNQNLTSHISHLTSQTGITLVSLLIYIVITTIVIALLATILAYFSKDVRDITSDNLETTQLDKFYTYFLNDVKKTGNGITSITNSNKTITFTLGNVYSFNSTNKAIYLNSIKIAENIENCLFSQSTSNGKTTITTNITINSTAYTRTFTLAGARINVALVDEEDFTYEQRPLGSSRREGYY